MMPVEDSDNMFATIMGLPLHPLVLHAAVVLLPLSAIGLCALILIPKWRKGPLDWLVVLGLAVGAGACVIAAESGEALAEMVGLPAEHAELGDQMKFLAIGLFVVGLIWYLMSKAAARSEATKHTALNVVGIIAILASILNIVWMVRVGHSGAEAVWGGTEQEQAGNVNTGDTSKEISAAEVAKHATAADCWTIVNGVVYDVSSFEAKHPGGASHITNMCGKESTAYFDTQHADQSRPENMLNGMAIGKLVGGPSTQDTAAGSSAPPTDAASANTSGTYTMAEVKAHSSASDCWTVVNGLVYDVTGFESEHPGGQSHITNMCGKESTAYFDTQHADQSRPENMLEGFAIGELAGGPSTQDSGAGSSAEPAASGTAGPYTMATVKSHNTASDCWTVVDGKVYDVSGFQAKHPGGASHIDNMCGKDATEYFQDEHGTTGREVKMLNGFQIGTLS